LESNWSYGIYAAYRDVRSYNGQSGYLYEMPTDSFTDIKLAPFNLYVLKKPEVWGALLGSLVLAGTVSYFVFHDISEVECNFSEESLFPLTAFSVGMSEESLFRGYLQPMLSEYFSPWGGIAISSLLFGAAHIPNAILLPEEIRWRYYSFSLPLITSMGVYLGWLTYKNNSLKESIALHSWYDFVIFAAGSLATSSVITGTPKFAISFPF